MRRLILIATLLLPLVATAQAQSPSADGLSQQLIHSRAIEAVIWGMSAVNYDLMRQEMLTKTAGKVGQVISVARTYRWLLVRYAL